MKSMVALLFALAVGSAAAAITLNPAPAVDTAAPPLAIAQLDGQGHQHGGLRAFDLEQLEMNVVQGELLKLEASSVLARSSGVTERSPEARSAKGADDARWTRTSLGASPLEGRSFERTPAPVLAPHPSCEHTVHVSASGVSVKSQRTRDVTHQERGRRHRHRVADNVRPDVRIVHLS
jgi:hypothetical protein